MGQLEGGCRCINTSCPIDLSVVLCVRAWEAKGTQELRESPHKPMLELKLHRRVWGCSEGINIVLPKTGLCLRQIIFLFFPCRQHSQISSKKCCNFERPATEPHPIVRVHKCRPTTKRTTCSPHGAP